MRRLGDIVGYCIAYNLRGHIGNCVLGYGEGSKITVVVNIIARYNEDPFFYSSTFHKQL